MRHKPRLRAASALLVLAVLAAAPVAAKPRKMTIPELDKVTDALLLVGETLEKRSAATQSDPDRKLADVPLPELLNDSSDPGGASAQTTYENRPDGNPPTFRDGVENLWRMIEEGRVQVDPAIPPGAYTRIRPGIDSDRIVISKALLDHICGASGAGNVERFTTKVNLAATLANELVHPWQAPTTSDAVHCDSERDSDTSMLAFLGALSANANNVTSVATIPDDCWALASCVSTYGIADSQWSDVTSGIIDLFDGYSDRQDGFDEALTAGTSWSAYYQSGPQRWNWAPSLVTVTGPSSISMTNAQDVTQDYVLPPGETIAQHVVTLNALNQSTLSVYSQDAGGTLYDHVYVDTNDDGLPEDSPFTVASTGPLLPLGEFDLYVLPQAPGDTGLEITGHTLIDTRFGEIYAVALDPAGVPLSPIQPVHADARLGAGGGGFVNFALETFDPAFPDIHNWIFSDEPTVAGSGDDPAAVLQIDLASGVWTSLPGPTTVAEAIAPDNPPGVLALAPGVDPVELTGDPGNSAFLAEVGGGAHSVVAGPGLVDASGTTGPLTPAVPIAPGLYLIDASGEQAVRFVPPQGSAVGATAHDEDGDATDERLHLTIDPPRLHVFTGIPSPPGSPAWMHDAQYVLESPHARRFRTWNDFDGRALVARFGDVNVTRFLTGGALRYATSLHDLDFDASADDAYVVRGSGLTAPAYALEVWTDVTGLPQSTQTVALAAGPETFRVTDLDGDGPDDVWIRSLPGNADACYTGNGNGTVAVGGCPQLNVTLTPDLLWPPNHRMVSVDASFGTGGFCDAPTIVLESVQSDEPDNGPGDGNTVNDIQGAAIGTADFAFDLRAERSGLGGGRTYTVEYSASDSCGNSASDKAEAFVPHDQGGVVEPLMLSLERTPAGTLVAWTPSPGAASYDVVRGALHNLQETATTIDLGEVVCIEAASPDASTLGDEDLVEPAAGQAFFYVVEYDDGLPSAYGTESAAKPRAPTAGDCP